MPRTEPVTVGTQQIFLECVNDWINKIQIAIIAYNRKSNSNLGDLKRFFKRMTSQSRPRRWVRVNELKMKKKSALHGWKWVCSKEWCIWGIK